MPAPSPSPWSSLRSSILLAVGAAAAVAGMGAEVAAQPRGSSGAGGARRWRDPPPPPAPVMPPSLAPPSGTGRLRNAAHGLCLDVAGWAAQGDSNVLLWDCNEDPDQVWSFTSTGELRDALTRTCLDVAGYDGAQGADVGVYRCEGLDDQRWALVARGPRSFELRSRKRGLCLDVAGQSGKRGDDVLLWACDGGSDQLWSWEPYAGAGPRTVYAPQRPPGPPPAPEQPPPAPQRRQREARARAMEDEAFRLLVAAVKNESFSQSQLDVIKQASGRHFFRVGQLKELIGLLGFSATKLSALEIGAPRLIDPENVFAFYDAFTFSADKEQAKQILRRFNY